MAWKDEAADPPAPIVQVGSTRLSYRLSCIQDLHAMLVEHGDHTNPGLLTEPGGSRTPYAVEAVAARSRSARKPAKPLLS